jgi:hypothetical protein
MPSIACGSRNSYCAHRFGLATAFSGTKGACLFVSRIRYILRTNWVQNTELRGCSIRSLFIENALN